MADQPRLLLITTPADFSAGLFLGNRDLVVTVVNFDAPADEISRISKPKFDFLYFRDPFNNDKIRQDLARQNTTAIVKQYADAYSVDGITDYDDLLFEDKWRQYQIFRQFMPKTQILKSFDELGSNSVLVKARISARSKGIYFNKLDIPEGSLPRNYLLQPKLKIVQEYRVYMIGRQIIEPLAIKHSKSSPATKVRLIAAEKQVPSPIAEICRLVYAATKFDFVGLDIARAGNKYYLLEVNRSPQFSGYQRLTDQNLANSLIDYLTSTKTF